MLSIRSRRRHTSPQKSPKKRSGARTFAIVALILLVVFPLVALIGGLASRSQAQPQTPVTAQKSSESTPASRKLAMICVLDSGSSKAGFCMPLKPEQQL